MNQDTVTRFEQQVIHGISRQRLSQVHTEDLHRSVGLSPEKLRRLQTGVGRDSPRQIDRVTQMRLPRSTELSRCPDFTADPDSGRAVQNRTG